MSARGMCRQFSQTGGKEKENRGFYSLQTTGLVPVLQSPVSRVSLPLVRKHQLMLLHHASVSTAPCDSFQSQSSILAQLPGSPAAPHIFRGRVYKANNWLMISLNFLLLAIHLVSSFTNTVIKVKEMLSNPDLE